MSDAGRIAATVDGDGVATIQLGPVVAIELQAAEQPAADEIRIGYAVVGVPHLVVLVGDIATVDVPARGRALRYGASRAPEGANVNFVSAGSTSREWRIRTYERGVEAETYACGTGAVAASACLIAWNLAPKDSPVSLLTVSGKTLFARLPHDPVARYSELSGEGRVVYDGVLQALR